MCRQSKRVNVLVAEGRTMSPMTPYLMSFVQDHFSTMQYLLASFLVRCWRQDKDDTDRIKPAVNDNDLD